MDISFPPAPSTPYKGDDATEGPPGTIYQHVNESLGAQPSEALAARKSQISTESAPSHFVVPTTRRQAECSPYSKPTFASEPTQRSGR